MSQTTFPSSVILPGAEQLCGSQHSHVIIHAPSAAAHMINSGDICNGGRELMKAVFHLIKITGHAKNVLASSFTVRHRKRSYSDIRIAVLMSSAESVARVESLLTSTFSGVSNLCCVVTASLNGFIAVNSTAIESDDECDRYESDFVDDSEQSVEEDEIDAEEVVTFYNSAAVFTDESSNGVDNEFNDTYDPSATGYVRPFHDGAKVSVVNYEEDD